MIHLEDFDRAEDITVVQLHACDVIRLYLKNHNDQILPNSVTI